MYSSPFSLWNLSGVYAHRSPQLRFVVHRWCYFWPDVCQLLLVYAHHSGAVGQSGRLHVRLWPRSVDSGCRQLGRSADFRSAV